MLSKKEVLEKIKECAEKNNGILSSIDNDNCQYLFPSERDYKKFLIDLSKDGIKIDAKEVEPKETYVI